MEPHTITESHESSHESHEPPPDDARIKDTLHKIGAEALDLVRDHVSLARLELAQQVRVAVFDGGVVVLGALLAFIGLALACTAAVLVLAPAIPALWVRLSIMAGVYVLVGFVLMGALGRKLRRDLDVETPKAQAEARHTLRELGDATH